MPPVVLEPKSRSWRVQYLARRRTVDDLKKYMTGVSSVRWWFGMGHPGGVFCPQASVAQTVKADRSFGGWKGPAVTKEAGFHQAGDNP